MTSLTVDTREFASAVAWAAKAIPNRPNIPVIGGMHIAAADGQIAVSGFDYESTTRAVVDVDGDLTGTWLVSGRLIEALVKTFNPKRPTVIDVDGASLVLRNGTATVGLPTMPVEDYPALPAMPEPVGTVDAAAFAAAVARVATATGDYATMPWMVGLHIRSVADTLFLAATDRYRGGLDDIPWQPYNAVGGDGIEVLPVCSQMARMVPAVVEGGDTITVSADSGLFGLSTERRSMVLRVLEIPKGGLPDMRRGFVKADRTTARVSASDLRKAVERAALVLEPKMPIVLAVSDGQIAVSGSGGGSVDDAVDAKVEGEPLTARFNHEYLVTAIMSTGAPEVDLWFDNARKPLSVTAADRDGDRYRHILMPVRSDG